MSVVIDTRLLVRKMNHSYHWPPDPLVSPSLVSLRTVRSRLHSPLYETPQDSYRNEENDKLDMFLLLPHEIILQICNFLQAKDLVRLAKVARAYREFVEEESLWKNLYLRLYGKNSWKEFTDKSSLVCSEPNLWKMLFIDAYSTPKTWQEVCTICNELSNQCHFKDAFVTTFRSAFQQRRKISLLPSESLCITVNLSRSSDRFRIHEFPHIYKRVRVFYQTEPYPPSYSIRF